MDKIESTCEQKNIPLSVELYEALREFCDKIGTPFLDFIEESLENATQRHELEMLLNDKAKLDEKIKNEQQRAFLEGFSKGVMVAFFAAGGRLNLSQYLTPSVVKKQPRYEVIKDDQLSLFD
jgi:hypothetical protein